MGTAVGPYAPNSRYMRAYGLLRVEHDLLATSKTYPCLLSEVPCPMSEVPCLMSEVPCRMREVPCRMSEVPVL